MSTGRRRQIALFLFRVRDWFGECDWLPGKRMENKFRFISDCQGVSDRSSALYVHKLIHFIPILG